MYHEKSQRVLEKIRKLLNLAHSVNEHEAAAAAAKAQLLLSEYNLTMSGLEEEEAAETLRASLNDHKTRQRLEPWAFMLAATVSTNFDCKYYHNQATGHTVFVGCGADSEVCAWTFGYLYKTLLALASIHMRGPGRRLRSPRSKRAAR